MIYHARGKTELSFYSLYRKWRYKIVIWRGDQRVCSRKMWGGKKSIQVCHAVHYWKYVICLDFMVFLVFVSFFKDVICCDFSFSRNIHLCTLFCILFLKEGPKKLYLLQAPQNLDPPLRQCIRAQDKAALKHKVFELCIWQMAALAYSFYIQHSFIKMAYDLWISAQQVNLIWNTFTLVTKKDTWETESSMFTQIQDTVHIFFPILHVKMDGHLKINTESYKVK